MIVTLVVVFILYVFLCVMWGNVCNEVNKKLYPSLEGKTLRNGFWIGFCAGFAPVTIVVALLKGIDELNLKSKEG